VTEPSQKTFSREEVEEILRRASEHAKAATDDGIRHEELLEAAREVGLDPAAIEAAAAELHSQRELKRDHDEARVQLTEERRRGWLQSLLTYVLVGACLTALNLTVAPGAWLVWVLAMWGLFVGLRGARMLFPVDEGKVEKRVEKKRRRRQADERRAQLKREAEAWAERLRREVDASAARADSAARASRDFEDAVEKGVSALLGVLARNIRDVAERAERNSQTDFDRYVARQKRAAGEPVPPPAKVRVEVHPKRTAPTDAVEEALGRQDARRERPR
jgi:hypothetical protein